MRLLGPVNSGAAVQTAGAGTGMANTSTSTRVDGRVAGIYVRYNDSCPNTTDVVIKTVGTSPAVPSKTFLTLTNKNADSLFMPRLVPQGVDGANLAALTACEPVAIFDYVNISIDGANTADSVDVWFLLEES